MHDACSMGAHTQLVLAGLRITTVPTKARGQCAHSVKVHVGYEVHTVLAMLSLLPAVLSLLGEFSALVAAPLSLLGVHSTLPVV